MTEKYLGDPRTINDQMRDAYLNTIYGEYEIYNSPLDSYSYALTVPGREPPFTRIERLKGTVLDIGSSTQMLVTLQEKYPGVCPVGIGVRLSESDKIAAQVYNLQLIEGSLFHPPTSLQVHEGKCRVIVSKNTFTQFKYVNVFSALEYVWDLLSYDQDPSSTGSAYIHMGFPQIINNTSNFFVDFSDLCETKTQAGFDMYPWTKRYGTSVIVMTKTRPDPLSFSITYQLDEYYWDPNDKKSSPLWATPPTKSGL